MLRENEMEKMGKGWGLKGIVYLGRRIGVGLGVFIIIGGYLTDLSVYVCLLGIHGASGFP